MVAALEETAAQPGKALVFDVTELDTPDRRVVVGRGDQDKGEGPTTTTIPRRSKPCDCPCFAPQAAPLRSEAHTRGSAAPGGEAPLRSDLAGMRSSAAW